MGNFAISLLALSTAMTAAILAQADRRLTAQAPAGAERRLALVIGNSGYAERPLPNASNDARAIASALRGIRFEVTEAVDLRRPQLERAVDDFADRLGAGDVALIYYAGHGFQMENENYMVPIGFTAADVADAKYEAYSVSRVHDKITARRVRLAIVILDACRDNPFAATRSSAGGWAAMAAGRGSFIVFATAPGQTASDNPNGRNGLFTTYLLDTLREPGLGLDATFNRVRERVVAASGNRQVPWTQSSIVGDFVFRSAAEAASAPAQAPSVSVAPDADLARREELAFWESIKDSRDARPFEEYLRQYPSGRFKVAADARLAELKAPSPARPRPAAASPASPATGNDSRAPAATGPSTERPETASEAEMRKYTFPVAHLHARLTFKGNPGCYGHLRITQDGASYQGEEGTVSFSKTNVTYIDIANTGAGSFLRLHASNGNWSFGLIDEADVQNRKYTGSYPPGQLGNVIVQRWGWISMDNGKRLTRPPQ